jgi:hypothetical protein
MAGGYCYRKINVPGTERYAETPAKNMYSHVADALQYLLLGAGEGPAAVEPFRRPRPVASPATYDPLGYNGPARNGMV